MGLARVYSPGCYQTGDVVELSEAQSHHLIVVLRKTLHTPFVLISGDGLEWQAEIVETKKKARVKIGESRQVSLESPFHIHLAQSLCKYDKFDWVVQKSVELGVKEITPIIALKSPFSKKDKVRLEKKYEHWEKIMISAIEQCGRNRLPLLHQPSDMPTFLHQQALSSSQRFILAPGGPSSLKTLCLCEASATLLIGPESGFDESEYTTAIDRGFQPLTLGPRVLRTETAPIAAISILQALYGDLG